MTTVTVKRFPHTFSRKTLISMLDGAGFWTRYNFLHLPADFNSMRAFGYAVINFVSHGDALRFGHVFHGYSGLVDETNSYMSLEVEWSGSLQGLEKHIERYRDSLMMHKRVRDELKPMLFVGGQRVAFPPPTKVVRIPRRANRKGEGRSHSRLLVASAVGLTMGLHAITASVNSVRLPNAFL